MRELLSGFIQSYNPKMGIGTILCERTRYWFHRDRISEGPFNPEVGDQVTFQASPKPVLDDRLPVAVRITVLNNSVGTSALAEQKDAPEVK